MTPPAPITLHELKFGRADDDRFVARGFGAGTGAPLELRELDVLDDHPEATALSVSGLDQRMFEALVERFGTRYTHLSLWKCPRLEDLSPLASLPQLTHVAIYWNWSATRLWDLASTPKLSALSLWDLKRLRSLEQLRDGTSMTDLELGDAPGSTRNTVYDSLDPLADLEWLRSLSIVVKRIEDGRVQPLGALHQLRELHTALNFWTTEECAWLRAHLPDDTEGRILEPTWTRTGGPSDSKNVWIVGKRKPRLHAEHDAERIARYVTKYHELVERFRSDPTRDP